jgi:hypothetical protein
MGLSAGSGLLSGEIFLFPTGEIGYNADNLITTSKSVL